jgi:hypothetical protein
MSSIVHAIKHEHIEDLRYSFKEFVKSKYKVILNEMVTLIPVNSDTPSEKYTLTLRGGKKNPTIPDLSTPSDALPFSS